MNNAHMMTYRRTVRAEIANKCVWILAAGSVLGMLSGCDKSDTKKTGTKTAATSAEPAPKPSEAPVIPPAPADINVNALSEDLKCTGKSNLKHACRIIKDFASAQRFTAQTPSGEGRWIGQAYLIENGVETERELILWAKTVPTGQVGPGDLPIKVGYEFFTDELKSHAVKLVRALSHGDPPSPKNQAFPFAKSLVPTKQRVIVNTSGASVHVTSEESIFIRAKAPRSVLLVNPSTAQGAGTGDGMYAELWLADW